MGWGLSIARNEALPVAVRRVGLVSSALFRTRASVFDRMRVLARQRPPVFVDSGIGPLGPIWVFWAQGLDRAPPLVQACVASIQAHAGGRQVHIVDQTSAHDYAALDEVIIRKTAEMGWTKFANALRLALLVQHGGTWFDATILQTGPMPDEILQHAFVLPQRPRAGRLVANWFIHARAGHPLLRAWLDALTAYWRLNLASRPYYQMHYLMEGLVGYSALAEDMLLRADGMMDAEQALALFHAAMGGASASTLDDLARQSWLHKLNHRVGVNTGLMAWMRTRAAPL